jgi:hypothetical protein
MRCTSLVEVADVQKRASSPSCKSASPLSVHQPRSSAWHSSSPSARKVSVDMIQKLSALHGRDVCEYLYLCVSKGLAGKVFVGFTWARGNLGCLHLPASVRAFLHLRALLARVFDNFHDLSCGSWQSLIRNSLSPSCSKCWHLVS